MVNVSKKAGLGNTLQRAQKHANERRNPRKSARHTVQAPPESDNRINLKSVTAQTNLDQFFEEAELAGKQFITEKRNVTVLDDNDAQINLYGGDEKFDQVKLRLEDIDIPSSLSVPRRPKWDSNTTPEQLEELEKLSFLAWRKKLARVQENVDAVLTPFEKNIEVWRQLWRVVERSDIVVQILDCRNPLLYLCDDLIKYVNEEFAGDKLNLILLNKADFLTEEQRKIWAKYFADRKIQTIFFSALYENESLKNNKSQSPTHSVDSENDEKQSSEDELANEEDEKEVIDGIQNNLNLESKPSIVLNDTRIYNKFELLDTWQIILKELDDSRSKNPNAKMDQHYEDNEANLEDAENHKRPLTVGLVGYPNVGKSSTINALLSAKRVAVSATPGKTKHFQTFLIDRDMMLCDCPGLVFPNFVSSKAEMVVNGILPIDQMKDYVSPVRIIVERIPRGYFEEIYGLAFELDAKQNIVADDLLNAFGFMRGYMTARGLPDISRAARKVCKDYVNGKILYCEPPPNVDKKLYQSHSKLAEAMERINTRGNNPDYALKITERQRRLMVQAKGTDISAREFDAQYFKMKTGCAHIKGLPGIGNLTQPLGQHGEVKVSKRERKHKKKEKLRRVYRDLDI